MNEMNDLIVKQTAERLFEANMMKCGFSYSPAGIYKAAFDEQGRLYRNWEARMKSCKPGSHEYPDLYRLTTDTGKNFTKSPSGRFFTA